jgi:hypothetical protein
MEKIQIFEPAMCCSTGVCGPSVDQDLIRITGAVSNLRRNGFNISRVNLTSDPAAFVQNQVVHNLLENEGVDVLPITIADGTLVKKRSYPTNQELADWTGIFLAEIDKKRQFQIKLNVNK